MDIDHRLAISYYKPIAVINESHHIDLVQHQETKKIAVKKVLDVYNRDVFDALYHNPITGTPRILDYYEEDNRLTIIEEYISGVSLREKIDNKELSSSDLLAYMLDLCDILAKLHTHVPAIIHRDIKPANIIITNYNKAVLLDFNAAKYYASEKNADTILLGTQGYAAPEQYGFGQSSPQTDIYSLGIVLKEMADACQLHKPYIDPIIDTCTQMEPAKRYPSVLALREALCTNRDISVRPQVNDIQRKQVSTAASTPLPQTSKIQPKSHTAVSLVPPGFRSRTPWKMLVAAFSYIFLVWLSLSTEIKNTYGAALWVERVTILIMLLFIVASVFNYLNVQKFMPLCRNPKKSLRILGIVVLDILVVFGLIVLMAIIQSFCPTA